MPKPMYPIHNKPFLHYLIEHLKEVGFQKVLLLLGYMPNPIIDYFGDGSDYGINIDYAISDTESETGRRLQSAASKIDPYFLLMYCDNYWPIRVKEMIEAYNETDADIQLTVYTNKDNYTKNNLQFDNQRNIVVYDKSRLCQGLNGVDIGFAIVNKSSLELLSQKNDSFEAVVYPTLTEQGRMSAFTTDHRYYSIGSFERIELTNAFFERKAAILLDRDGVLNKKAPRGEYICNWNEFEWIPGAKEAIKLLKRGGYRIIIISNQAGIARGMMAESDLNDIHNRMSDDIEGVSKPFDAIYYCPHHWNEQCECRKPNAGSFFMAQRNFHLDLSRIYYIGDDPRDQEAAANAGCLYFHVDENHSLLSYVKKEMIPLVSS